MILLADWSEKLKALTRLSKLKDEDGFNNSISQHVVGTKCLTEGWKGHVPVKCSGPREQGHHPISPQGPPHTSAGPTSRPVAGTQSLGHARPSPQVPNLLATVPRVRRPRPRAARPARHRRPRVRPTGAAEHEGGVGPAACARSAAEAAWSTCGAQAAPAPRRPPLPF